MTIDMSASIEDLVTILPFLLFIAAVILFFRQLNNSKKASYSASAKMTFDMLQDKNVRAARTHVFKDLPSKSLNEWTDEQIERAGIVCNTYSGGDYGEMWYAPGNHASIF